MNIKNKGCVYFFKHVGLNPIKIGFSTNSSPFLRFEAFKTYAPNGAQLLGFIICENSKELETVLHKKFSNKRLNGEWFDINESEALECIKFYSDQEFINHKNNFEIEWSKKVHINELIQNNDYYDKFFKNYSFVETEDFKLKKIVQKKELKKIMTYKEAEILMKTNNVKYRSYRINSVIVSGYKLFVKSF